jgi:multidrug resistance efflux pump
MRNQQIFDLNEVSEFRQTLEARPPRIVHGTVMLLATLLGVALAWAALTRADLVVRAAGRVRPVSAPKKVFNAGRSDVLSASAGGRVVEVNFREGEEVRAGDVLVRLDAGRLDNEIARRQKAVQTGEEELARIARLEELEASQLGAARAKLEAELAQAQEEMRRAKEARVIEMRLAEVAINTAQDDVDRLRQIAVSGTPRATSASDLVKADAQLRQAKENMDKASLPVEQGRVEVARRALALAEKDAAVRQEELVLKSSAKKGEVDTARLELAALEAERGQSVLQAPTAGVVTAGDVKVGDLLEPGKPVLEIAEQHGFRFEVVVPTEEVGHLQVGMPVRIKLDAYDYQRYGTLAGTVCFVSPDSGGPGEPRAGAYVVRIEVDGDAVGRGEFRGPIKLGMTGQAEIVTGQESLFVLLLKKIHRTISLG